LPYYIIFISPRIIIKIAEYYNIENSGKVI